MAAIDTADGVLGRGYEVRAPLMTLKCMPGKVASESHRDTWVPEIMATYRATVYEATQYSPNSLMFSRELRASSTWYWEDPGRPSMLPGKFVETVRLTQREAYALARDHLGRREK